MRENIILNYRNYNGAQTSSSIREVDDSIGWDICGW